MTPEATDEAIQKFFLFQFRDQGMPWHPRHGTREDLARLFGQLGFSLGAEIGTPVWFVCRPSLLEKSEVALVVH